MTNWLKKVISRNEPSSKTIIELQAKLQETHLALIEKNRIIEHLSQENDRINRYIEEQIDEKYSQAIENLFIDLSAPVTHLLTQAYLIENLGTQVQTIDVLATSKRLVQVLRSAGLETIGQVGEFIQFNFNDQMPLGTDSTIKDEDRVVIRFVGLKYRGKILRKILVEKIED